MGEIAPRTGLKQGNFRRDLCLLWACFAPEVPQKALPHANKKTIMLNGFMRLQTENGGICAHRDVEHKSRE